MKKIFALAICAALAAAVALPILYAQEDPAVVAKRAAIMEKAKQTLASHQWTIYLTIKPATQRSRAVIETDVLTFGDGTVLSQNLSSQGYAKNGSNYSMFPSDDGTVVFETMQMHENEKDIAFLRGELRGNVLVGAVVMKPQKGEQKVFPYSSVSPQ